MSKTECRVERRRRSVRRFDGILKTRFAPGRHCSGHDLPDSYTFQVLILVQAQVIVRWSPVIWCHIHPRIYSNVITRLTSHFFEYSLYQVILRHSSVCCQLERPYRSSEPEQDFGCYCNRILFCTFFALEYTCSEWLAWEWEQLGRGKSARQDL
jgi:hypothetical protein